MAPKAKHDMILALWWRLKDKPSYVEPSDTEQTSQLSISLEVLDVRSNLEAARS